MKRPLMIAAGLALLAGAAYAATRDYSFTGNFSGDADSATFGFTIDAPSDVTLRSYSYAGGTNADRTVIPAGGFDPILALWTDSGGFIQEYDDGPGAVPADPVTGAEFDSNLLLTNLAAGSYIASITQYDNFHAGPNLSDGFHKSDPFFTGPAFGCSNGQFCDAGGNNRTNFWAFDVSGVDSATAGPPPPPQQPSTVPLPAGLPLLLSGILGLGLAARRKKKRA